MSEPQPETSSESTKTNVFVQGFGMNGTEQDIRDIFKDIGEIVEVTIKRRDFRQPPYAFVKFATPKDAEAALTKNNTKYEQNVLRVELSNREKPYSKEESLPPRDRNRYQDRHRYDNRDRRYDDRDRDRGRDRDRDRDRPPPRSDYRYDPPRYNDYDRYDDRRRYNDHSRYSDYDRSRYPDSDRYDRQRYDDHSDYGDRRYDSSLPSSGTRYYDYR